jgi:hypothetical protein
MDNGHGTIAIFCMYIGLCWFGVHDNCFFNLYTHTLCVCLCLSPTGPWQRAVSLSDSLFDNAHRLSTIAELPFQSPMTKFPVCIEKGYLLESCVSSPQLRLKKDCCLLRFVLL